MKFLIFGLAVLIMMSSPTIIALGHHGPEPDNPDPHNTELISEWINPLDFSDWFDDFPREDTEPEPTEPITEPIPNIPPKGEPITPPNPTCEPEELTKDQKDKSQKWFEGYDDAWKDNNFRPREPGEDYQEGYKAGWNDKQDGNPRQENPYGNIPEPWESYTSSLKQDCDEDTKSGGADPIVIGKWGYIEPGNGWKCQNSPNPFDFDNDGHKEPMCYWYHPESTILFVDFNNNKKLDNGYELLNDPKYPNALHILKEDPELCINNICYLWKDSNRDIFVQENEITRYDVTFNIGEIFDYGSDGKLTPENIIPREEMEDDPRGFFIYGETNDSNLGPMYATKPTYWQILH